MALRNYLDISFSLLAFFDLLGRLLALFDLFGLVQLVVLVQASQYAVGLSCLDEDGPCQPSCETDPDEVQHHEEVALGR